MLFSSFERGVWAQPANNWERSAQNNLLYGINFYAWNSLHNMIIDKVEIRSSNSDTSNSDLTSAISNKGTKLFLRVEWSETVRTRRNPDATKKFSNLSPEILI